MASVDIEKLVVQIEARTRSYENALKRIEGKTGRSSRRMSNNFRKLNREMAKSAITAKKLGTFLGAALLAKAGVGGLSAFTKAASDAEEMQAKFQAVFGNLSGEVEGWAATQSRAIGRSKLSLQDYLATLQDTFVPLGFARNEAAKMSKTLAALAIDVASFSNAGDEETIRNFTSALVGNHEAVRRYGIVITQNRLKQQLLNDGVKGGVQGATELEKVIARLNVILASTKDAQGDAARTAGSYANQIKALEGDLKDLSATLGGFITRNSGPVIGFFRNATILAKLTAEQMESLDTVLKSTDTDRLERRLNRLRKARQELSDKIQNAEKIEGKSVYQNKYLDGMRADFDAISAKAQKVLNLIAKIKGESVNEVTVNQPGIPIPRNKPNDIADSYYQFLEKQREKAAEAAKRQAERINAVKEALIFENDQLAKSPELQRIHNQLRAAGVTIESKYGQQIAALTKKLIESEKRTKAWKETQDKLNEAKEYFAEIATDGLTDIIVEGGKAKDVVNSLIKSLARAAIQGALLNKGPLSGLFGGKGIGGTLFGAISNTLFGGARAVGGPVSAGKSYLVGERGPELFSPSQSGRITANNKLGGGGGGVRLNIVNQTGAPVSGEQVSTRKAPDGQEIIDIVLAKVDARIASGGFDTANSARYGARPVLNGGV